MVAPRADRPPRAPSNPDLSGTRSLPANRRAGPHWHTARVRPGASRSPRPTRPPPAPPRRTTAPSPRRNCPRRDARRRHRAFAAAYSSRASGTARRWSRMSSANRQPGEPVTRTCRLTGRPGSALPCSRFGQVSPGSPRAVVGPLPGPARQAGARPARPASVVGLVQRADRQHQVDQVLRRQPGHGGRADVADVGAAARPSGVPDPGDQPLRPAPARSGRGRRCAAAGRAGAARPVPQVLLEGHQPVRATAGRPAASSSSRPPSLSSTTSAAARRCASSACAAIRAAACSGVIPRVSTSRRIRVSSLAETTTTRWYDGARPVSTSSGTSLTTTRPPARRLVSCGGPGPYPGMDDRLEPARGRRRRRRPAAPSAGRSSSPSAPEDLRPERRRPPRPARRCRPRRPRGPAGRRR